MNNVVIGIADWGIEITSKDLSLIDALHKHYSPFLTVSPSNFICHVATFEYEPPGGINNPVVKFTDGALDLIWQNGYGSISRDISRGNLTIPTSNAILAIDYYLRCVLALLSFNEGGFLMHAAGILSGYYVDLFIGPSGSGKTTVAQNSTSKVVLNDDLVVLRKINAGWLVYSTPFRNPTQVNPEPGNGWLRSINWLVKDLTPFRASIDRADLLAKLSSCLPIIIQSQERIPIIFTRLLELIEEIPAYQLHFLPDQSFWEIIDKKSD